MHIHVSIQLASLPVLYYLLKGFYWGWDWIHACFISREWRHKQRQANRLVCYRRWWMCVISSISLSDASRSADLSASNLTGHRIYGPHLVMGRWWKRCVCKHTFNQKNRTPLLISAAAQVVKVQPKPQLNKMDDFLRLLWESLWMGNKAVRWLYHSVHYL